MCAHHRRRLRKAGASRALAASGMDWATTASPARDGNALEVLVDGAEALPRDRRGDRGRALARPRSPAGTSRPTSRSTRGERAGDRCATLLADGRRARRRARAALGGRAAAALPPVARATCATVARRRSRAARGIACALDAHERPLHCHHEKLVIVDGEVAFVGGIDLTDLARRPLRHAASTRRAARSAGTTSPTRLRGPGRRRRRRALRAALARGDRRAAARAAPPPRAGRRRRAAGRAHGARARSTTRCRAASSGSSRPTLRALRSARAARSTSRTSSCGRPRSSTILARQAAQPAERRASGCCVVLPAKPNNGADDTRGQLGVLADADDGAGRLLACTLYARRRRRDRPRLRARQGRRSSTTAG